MDLGVWFPTLIFCLPCRSQCKPGRLFRQTLSDTNKKIDSLSTALSALKDALNSGVACQALFISDTLLQTVEQLGMWKCFVDTYC